MLEFIQKFWLETVLSGIVIAGTTLTKITINRFKKEIDEQQVIKSGLLALLHDRLYQACYYHITNGFITPFDLCNLEHLYMAYHNLGGNGTGTELFNRCKALPIKPNESANDVK